MERLLKPNTQFEQEIRADSRDAAFSEELERCRRELAATRLTLAETQRALSAATECVTPVDLAFEHSQQPQLIVTREGRVLSANQTAREWLKTDPIVGLDCSELFIRVDTTEPVSMARLIGYERPFLVHRRGADSGCPAWLDLRALDLETYWIGVRLRGIGADAVRRHFYDLFDDLDLYVFAKDADFRYTHANRRLCEWLSHPREELIGKRDESFLSNEMLRSVREADRAVLDRGDLLVPARKARKQDTNEWLPYGSYHALKIPVLDDSGGIVGLLGFAVDASRQETGAAAVRAHEHRLSVALDQILEGCQIIDRNYRYSYLNDAAERQTRRPRSELLHRTLAEAWPGIESTQTYAMIHDCLTTGSTHVVDTEFAFPNGEVGFFEMRMVPVPEGAFVLSIDRTVRRRAEQEREQLRKRLAQAQALETVGQLSGGIAHDFNNMLAVILTYTELSLSTLEPEHPAREDLESIRQAAQRSSGLTNQLLTFARKQTIAPQFVDLNRCIADLLDMLKRLLGENIEVSFRPASGLWPVHIDPSQVDQIIVNLCVNARDAIVDTGHVRISTSNVQRGDDGAGDRVRIMVEDDGTGMDDATRERMFEPFFTTKSPGIGTGLGLASVCGIVQQNQGLIDVCSELGRGTRISIDFPRCERVPAETRTAPAPASSEAVGGETVLIVEDEPALLRAVARIVKALKYRVLRANSAIEALRLAARHDGPIDVVLTDVIMPGMNGRELARRLTALRPGLRVLYTSGYTGDVIGRHGVLAPGIDVLTKPYPRHELARRLRELLSRPANS